MRMVICLVLCAGGEIYFPAFVVCMGCYVLYMAAILNGPGNNIKRRCFMSDGEIGLAYVIVTIVSIVIASMMMKKG